MKNIMLLVLLFYVSVWLNFLQFDSQSQLSANVGLVALFLALTLFVISVSFCCAILFDERFSPIHRHVNSVILWLSINFFINVVLKSEVYQLISTTMLHYIVLVICFSATIISFVTLISFSSKHQLTVTSSTFKLLKIGAEWENTPLFKAVSTLDRYLAVFAVVSAILESVMLYIIISVLLLLLTIKHTRIVYKAFICHFSRHKEAYITVISFYGTYTIAIFSWIFVGKFLVTFFIASLSMWYIKIYFHQIVKEQLRQEALSK